MRKVELRGFVLAVDAIGRGKLLEDEDFTNQIEKILQDYLDDVSLQSIELMPDGFYVVELKTSNVERLYHNVHSIVKDFAWIKKTKNKKEK